MSLATIESLDNLRQLASDRLEKTKTYPILPEVLEAYYREIGDRLDMEPISEEEKQEIADYLEVPVQEITFGKWKSKSAACPNCGRQLNFVDFAHEAVSIGRHTKQFIVDIINRKHGAFIVIEGSNDAGHVMRCLKCGNRDVHLQQVEGPMFNMDAYAYCFW